MAKAGLVEPVGADPVPAAPVAARPIGTTREPALVRVAVLGAAAPARGQAGVIRPPDGRPDEVGMPRLTERIAAGEPGADVG